MLLLQVFVFYLFQLAACQPIYKRDLAIDYQTEKVRGVNLGGWFLIEPFITPSLFDAFSGGEIPVDEYHFTKAYGKDKAKQVLEQHWSTWYSEDDFKRISDAGMNAVRIPIGYWAFQILEGDPYVDGQQKYLDKALKWCRKHNLKAWIDLHGVPGGQNGFDNSGIRDQLDFQKGDTVQQTVDVLQQIIDKYAGDDYLDVVIGIELVNEPNGSSIDMDELKQFYYQGYNMMRQSGSIQAVILHDAFQTPDYWNAFMSNYDQNWNVVIDHHHYQVFSAGELQRSLDDHISAACTLGDQHKGENHWNLVGEWSAALTDCARWLNGVGRGARWSGDFDNSPYIGSCDQFIAYESWPDWQKVNTRKYLEAQLDAYETRSGWFFWNWKCESAIEWDMKQLLEVGLFPQPLDDRQYPNQCNY